MPPLHGVFAVIKPKGITCAQLGNKIKELLIQDAPYEKQLWYQSSLRLGHGGVLDSDAHGVLAIGIGAGCKQLKDFLFGQKPDGKITSGWYTTGHVTRTELERELMSFVGSTLQAPPAYSALKHKGERLSDLARAGRPVPIKQPRSVILYSAKCTHFQLPFYSLEIKCGPGFYVRSLVHDLGKVLKTCSHVVDLERTKHGIFTRRDALCLSEITMENVKQAIERAKKLQQKQSSTEYQSKDSKI